MLYLTQVRRTASCIAKFYLLVHERGSSGIACWRALLSLAEGRPPIEYTHWCCVPQTLYRLCMHTPFNIFLILCRNFTQTFPGCANEREFENEIFENEVQLSRDKQTLHACVRVWEEMSQKSCRLTPRPRKESLFVFVACFGAWIGPAILSESSTSATCEGACGAASIWLTASSPTFSSASLPCCWSDLQNVSFVVTACYNDY